jgi:hypothetical protein
MLLKRENLVAFPWIIWRRAAFAATWDIISTAVYWNVMVVNTLDVSCASCFWGLGIEDEAGIRDPSTDGRMHTETVFITYSSITVGYEGIINLSIGYYEVIFSLLLDTRLLHSHLLSPLAFTLLLHIINSSIHHLVLIILQFIYEV